MSRWWQYIEIPGYPSRYERECDEDRARQARAGNALVVDDGAAAKIRIHEESGQEWFFVEEYPWA